MESGKWCEVAWWGERENSSTAVQQYSSTAEEYRRLDRSKDSSKSTMLCSTRGVQCTSAHWTWTNGLT